MFLLNTTDSDVTLRGMKEFRSVVASAVGLHARPAALFASTAKASGSTVRLAKIVDGHGGTPGVMKRARRVVRQSARAAPLGHPSIASFKPPHPAL